jgi:hypothetical protein
MAGYKPLAASRKIDFTSENQCFLSGKWHSAILKYTTSYFSKPKLKA